ncbi:MAG: rod shape-determining protein MreC [Candidatus Omnitrophica bacterium]|nr:rod shape-determining protein MreC [Candidatus Omnitrophota bacterium]
MLKKTSVVIGVASFLFFLTTLPVSQAVSIKGSAASFLEWPLVLSKETAAFVTDLYRFRQNARENRALKTRLAEIDSKAFDSRELALENARLTKLLGLVPPQSLSFKRLIHSRVIGRSPSAWNRVFLIDKGTKDGVKMNRVVLSDFSLVGKIVESGPSVSKVLLMQDPNFRIGVLVQRTRQEGVLTGSLSGRCAIRYLSKDEEIKIGDEVETAGFGGLFPKGVRVGKIVRVRKDAGQNYQEAELEPFADPGRAEEVTCAGS